MFEQAVLCPEETSNVPKAVLAASGSPAAAVPTNNAATAASEAEAAAPEVPAGALEAAVAIHGAVLAASEAAVAAGGAAVEPSEAVAAVGVAVPGTSEAASAVTGASEAAGGPSAADLLGVMQSLREQSTCPITLVSTYDPHLQSTSSHCRQITCPIWSCFVLFCFSLE